MTDTEQRIAISEAIGWTNVHILRDEDKQMKVLVGNCPCFPNAPVEVPYYPEDLNAMHKVEGTLTECQRIAYLENLTPKHTPIKDQDWTAFHATAAQRAEAFLLTVGKWKNQDDKRRGSS